MELFLNRIRIPLQTIPTQSTVSSLNLSVGRRVSTNYFLRS